MEVPFEVCSGQHMEALVWHSGSVYQQTELACVFATTLGNHSQALLAGTCSLYATTRVITNFVCHIQAKYVHFGAARDTCVHACVCVCGVCGVCVCMCVCVSAQRNRTGRKQMLWFAAQCVRRRQRGSDAAKHTETWHRWSAGVSGVHVLLHPNVAPMQCFL